jgi:type III pantothenate kinase|tara:strand:- start:56 stop:793 length:738 start_codon:yes stop_codon:yes gene_type:complete
MIVLVDVGNTSIKKCKLDKGKLSEREHLDYSKKKPQEVINFFKNDFKNKENFLLCSVVPQITQLFTENCKKKLLDFHIVNKSFLKNMIDKKININELGADRIVNYLGLKAKYPKAKDFLIIDFGTATTIDIIINSKYLGGVILPGLLTSYKNLINSASLLNDFEIKFTKLVYGTNTKNALLSGSFNGYSHMINGYIKQLQNLFKKRFKKIVTGGYGTIFINSSKSLDYEKDLTFNGLKYYNENFL